MKLAKRFIVSAIVIIVTDVSLSHIGIIACHNKFITRMTDISCH